jgi:DNA invertase Pin-like site-specific DNA recombinase
MLSSAASLLPSAKTATPRPPRRATLPEKNRNLFDLLLDETDAWETLHEEHQALAIQILARLIAQAVPPNQQREKNHDSSKVKPNHLQRAAIVYVRQSSPDQVKNHRESTARQYALVEKACQLGWAQEQVIVIDEDLGLSGSGWAERSGFGRLTAEVAFGRVGIVLGLEVSRLARNHADWYRLFDFCGVTDTLVGDGEGVHHAALFNDRLILGLKGILAEAELHVLRARLEGGIRHKAARGELRRGLPVGFVWGEADGEVRFHPDQSVVHTLRTVFSKFTELGSVRKVWLWFRSEGLSFPLRPHLKSEIRWIAPTYTDSSGAHPSGVCWRLPLRKVSS